MKYFNLVHHQTNRPYTPCPLAAICGMCVYDYISVQYYDRYADRDNRAVMSIALKTSSLVNNSGVNNPKHSGITNDEFREHYIQCCISLGYQPGLKRFSKWFNAATGKVFPSSLSAHRFNFGKDLFAEVERSYGLFHRRSQSD